MMNHRAELKLKNLFRSIGFYLLCLAFYFVFNYLFPGDSCNPGMGFLILLLSPLLIAFLLIRNFRLLGKGRKENMYSFFLHLFVLLSALIGLAILDS